MSVKVALALSLLFALFVISCEDNETPEGSTPVVGAKVQISGTVRAPSGDPANHVSLHVIYEMEPSSYYQDETWFDVIEPSWVTLQVFDVEGNMEVSLVDGLMSAGRYRIDLSPYAFPNGAHQLVYRLWTVDRDSLLFLSGQWWLKNITDVNILAQMTPATVTAASGHYELSAAAGLSIPLRDELNQYIGTAELNRLTLLALHPDYPPVWYTLNVFSGQFAIVDLEFPQTNSLPPGLIIQVGDTTIIIPDSAQQFADSNFDVDAYLLREWQLAVQNPTMPFNGDLADWKSLAWVGTQGRHSYLEFAVGYSHDILSASPSEYYQWISSRMHQFGYGWDDTHSPSLNPNIENLNPGLWAVSGDDPATIIFEGTSQLAQHYHAMWIRIPSE